MALGSGQVDGGVWGHGGVPTYMHMHMYTCIEIANGFLNVTARLFAGPLSVDFIDVKKLQ